MAGRVPLSAVLITQNAARCIEPCLLSRHRDHLFTFLDKVEVPFDNNHAERQIRPAVIIRKNSLCNRSDDGAHTQAVLMSVYRTLRLRGHDPTKTIADALRQMLQTGTLPPLPTQTVADG